MAITTEQKQKWLYTVNKHKNLIDNTITKAFKSTCENEELIAKIYESAPDSIGVASLQALLQFYGNVLDTIWENLETSIKKSLEKSDPVEEQGK